MADLGRWISRDPIGESGGVNLYGMIGNQLVNWIDLFGLQSCCPPPKVRATDGRCCKEIRYDQNGRERCIVAVVNPKDRNGGDGTLSSSFDDCMAKCLRLNYGETLNWANDLGVHSYVAGGAAIATEIAGRALNSQLSGQISSAEAVASAFKGAANEAVDGYGTSQASRMLNASKQASSSAARSGIFKSVLGRIGMAGAIVGGSSTLFLGAHMDVATLNVDGVLTCRGRRFL